VEPWHKTCSFKSGYRMDWKNVFWWFSIKYWGAFNSYFHNPTLEEDNLEDIHTDDVSDEVIS
jgi:hypothetical protein